MSHVDVFQNHGYENEHFSISVIKSEEKFSSSIVKEKRMSQSDSILLTYMSSFCLHITVFWWFCLFTLDN